MAIIRIEGNTAREYVESTKAAKAAVTGLTELSMELESDNWFFEDPETGELTEVIWCTPPEQVDPFEAMRWAAEIT